VTDRRASVPLALGRTALRHGLPGLRMAAWTARCTYLVRRQLAEDGLAAVRIPAPPRSVGDDLALVRRVLRRVGANCLERALVLQRWYAGRRSARTLVIGVTAPSAGFHAHAWLDGDTDAGREAMVEILRRPAPQEWLLPGLRPDPGA
jgi:hypothetical protein